MEVQNLDFYCERLDASFWSEPLNAFSNLGFVFAGLVATVFWYRNYKRGTQTSPIRVLILSLLLISIGIGSFIFHTYADTKTILLDLVPIFIFTSVYLYHSFHFYLKVSAGKSWGLLVLCILSMICCERLIPRDFLNGSMLYLPPFLFLVSIAFMLKKWKNQKWFKFYFTATVIFLVSLICRTIDMAVCPSFPIGTHFLWHTFNSVFLAVLMYIALNFQERDRDNLA